MDMKFEYNRGQSYLELENMTCFTTIVLKVINLVITIFPFRDP